MNANGKAVVYVDVDDEITSIIDKMQAADGRIVALVLPKRAALLQSIVNMKLLKRSADDKKKRVVLITTEAGLLPLAGAAGLHVASTLQSVPAVPAVPGADDADDVINEPTAPAALADDPDDTIDLSNSSSTAIGDLAGIPAAAAINRNEPETIDLDNTEGAAPAVAVAAKAPKTKKNSKLKVPNFSRFKVLIALGVLLLVALGVFLYLALAVLPKATVTILTNSSDVKTNATVTLDPKATTVSSDLSTIPASVQQKQQSSTQQVPSTGSKNSGNKASGSVTMSAGSCGSDVPNDVPAGTGLSANSLTYITQSNVSFVPTISKGKCTFQSANPTNIVAQSPGANYNTSATSLSVAGRSDVTAKASDAISGGTDNIVKVVSQADIDNAKQKLSTQDSTAIKQGLQSALQQNGYTPIVATFNGGTPNVSTSANVGDASDTVTVTQVNTFTMYGIKQSDLKQVIVGNVNNQIDEAKQAILDDGASKATFKVENTAPEQVVIGATSTTGPHIVVSTLKSQIAGKKSGAITNLIKGTPGVTDVKVKYSPFWVDSAPHNTSKITVIFQKS